MQIVIDIDEDYVKIINKNGASNYPEEVIQNGIPLDKIRAEIHATAEMHEDGDYYLRDEWIDEIFDKYKAGNEDKKE